MALSRLKSTDDSRKCISDLISVLKSGVSNDDLSFIVGGDDRGVNLIEVTVINSDLFYLHDGILKKITPIMLGAASFAIAHDAPPSIRLYIY